LLQAINLRVVELNENVEAFLNLEKPLKSAEFLHLVS